MKRSDARTLAVTTLTALTAGTPPTPRFVAVLDHEPDIFPAGGAIATVMSASTSLIADARGALSAPSEITVAIYVPRPKGANAAGAEHSLDDLVRAALLALGEAFHPHVSRMQIGPSESGYRTIDGRSYRAERMRVRVDDSYEED
jgi:hypothetical protein